MGKRSKLPEQTIIKRYLNGESSTEIAKDADITSRSVSRILRRNRIECRGIYSSKYNVNEDFFKRWSSEMAYVLGFIVTDGCVAKNHFYIAQKESDILYKIANALDSNIPVVKRENNGGKSYIHTLTVNRKSMVADLRALGITENKSLTVPFPNVPAEYLPHFIRGVIDGDGWVQDRGYTCRITSGSAQFAEGLLFTLKSQGFNTRIETDNYGGNNVYRVVTSGKDDILRLSRWLYADCGVLFLPRKRERFETHMIAS